MNDVIRHVGLLLATVVGTALGGHEIEARAQGAVMVRPLHQNYPEYSSDRLATPAIEACRGDFANESEPFDNVVRMHVPKTGTSFTLAVRKILHACYGLDHQNYPCWEGKGARNLPDDHCSDHLYDCNGHYGYGSEHMNFWKANANGTFKTLTMIRDPAHRLLSAYLDKRHRNGFKGANGFRSTDFGDFTTMSIQEFVSLHAVQGCQVKMLTGGRCAEDARLDEQRLRDAKAALLNSFDFFGITDRFDESIWLLHHTFGILPSAEEFQPYRFHQPPVFFPRGYRPGDDTKRTLDELEPHLLQWLRAVDSWDYQLFRFAQSEFNKRLAAALAQVSKPCASLFTNTTVELPRSIDLLAIRAFAPHRMARLDVAPGYTGNDPYSRTRTRLPPLRGGSTDSLLQRFSIPRSTTNACMLRCAVLWDCVAAEVNVSRNGTCTLVRATNLLRRNPGRVPCNATVLTPARGVSTFTKVGVFPLTCEGARADSLPLMQDHDGFVSMVQACHGSGPPNCSLRGPVVPIPPVEFGKKGAVSRTNGDKPLKPKRVRVPKTKRPKVVRG